jgi:hypothetical protein
MKRLYFLVPTLENTTSIVQELQQGGVPEACIYIVGKNHHALQQAHLHEASLLQTTDVIPAIERGLAYGGAVGLIAGLAAIVVPPAGLIFGGGAVVGLSLFGAGFGAWASSMIGISILTGPVEKFEAAIDRGQFLMLVDIAKEREANIIDLIQRHHPEALIENIALPAQKAKTAA